MPFLKKFDHSFFTDAQNVVFTICKDDFTQKHCPHIVKYYKPQVCIPQEFTVYNPWKKDGTTVHNSFFHKLYLSSSRNLGKLFFHSVSRLNLVALKASACCSIVSRTIFQKHSDTAKLRFLVVI